jgi:hypothetical protein
VAYALGRRSEAVNRRLLNGLPRGGSVPITPGTAQLPGSRAPASPLLPLVALLSCALGVSTAEATVVGSNVLLENFYPNLGAPPSATFGPATVVDPGMEFPHVLTGFPSGNPVFSVDVGATATTVNHLGELNNLGCGSGTDPFNGFVFTFSGLPAPIASVTLNPSSTLTPYAFWATSNQVFVDYQCLGVIANNVSTILDITLATADHLQCFRIRDPLKLRGRVDLDSPQFGLTSGCTIGRARYFCVPAAKSVTAATDNSTGDPIMLLPISGEVLRDTICYNVKCPRPVVRSQLVSDQFGSRTITMLGTKLLCTPAVKGPPP